jgi:hypothetical protein
MDSLLCNRPTELKNHKQEDAPLSIPQEFDTFKLLSYSAYENFHKILLQHLDCGIPAVCILADQ